MTSVLSVSLDELGLIDKLFSVIVEVSHRQNNRSTPEEDIDQLKHRVGWRKTENKNDYLLNHCNQTEKYCPYIE